jgi:hypothetical protein
MMKSQKTFSAIFDRNKGTGPGFYFLASVDCSRRHAHPEHRGRRRNHLPPPFDLRYYIVPAFCASSGFQVWGSFIRIKQLTAFQDFVSASTSCTCSSMAQSLIWRVAAFGRATTCATTRTWPRWRTRLSAHAARRQHAARACHAAPDQTGAPERQEAPCQGTVEPMPDVILNRRKTRFGIPVQSWLADSKFPGDLPARRSVGFSRSWLPLVAALQNGAGAGRPGSALARCTAIP